MGVAIEALEHWASVANQVPSGCRMVRAYTHITCL